MTGVSQTGTQELAQEARALAEPCHLCDGRRREVWSDGVERDCPACGGREARIAEVLIALADALETS